MRSARPLLLLFWWVTPVAWAVESDRDADSPSEDVETIPVLGLPRAPLDEPIVTDRPDFTESTDTVPFGHVQLEMGYTFSCEHEGAVQTRSHTVPELLLRLGMVKDFEIRIGWEGYTYTHTHERVESDDGYQSWQQRWEQGASDLYLGTKVRLLNQDAMIPHLALITAVTVPSGSAGVSSGDVDPEAVLCWGYDLTDRLSLAGNVGLAVPSSEQERFLQTTGSVSVAYALTDRLGSYLEYYGFYPNDRGRPCAHTLDGGFTYLLTDNLQVDWRMGFGLNNEADDFFTGVGLAWRF